MPLRFVGNANQGPIPHFMPLDPTHPAYLGRVYRLFDLRYSSGTVPELVRPQVR
jgi:hypothetical protein